MASTVVAAILALSDRMSPKLLECGRNWDKLSKAEQRAAKSSASTVHSWIKQIDKATSKALKFGAAMTAVAAVAAIKTGFAEAFDLESYRSQLETATKSTQRAAEVMTYAVKLANATPYESNELVKASAALEMAGLKSETYLTVLGDTAAGANKSISDIQSQFVKAFATGTTGEFFDMINVSRQAFADFAKENKLATSSLADTQAGLKKFLDQQFGGGMEKLARTTKGAWSTITGTIKSSLSQIVGMGMDGAIRTGSALDKLNTKLQSIATQLDKWQTDGTIQRLSEDIGGAFEKALEIGEKIGKFASDNRWAIVIVGGLALVITAVTKLITWTATLIKNLKTINTLFTSLGKSYFGTGAGAAAGAGAAGAEGAAASGAGAAAAAAAVGTKATHLSRVASMGSAGTQSSLASVGLAWKLGSLQDKIVDEGVAKMKAEWYSNRPRNTVKEKDLSLLPIHAADSYESTYRETAYNRAFAEAQKKNNVFNITINGAQKSDEELADIVAKHILEVVDNT